MAGLLILLQMFSFTYCESVNENVASFYGEIIYDNFKRDRTLYKSSEWQANVVYYVQKPIALVELGEYGDKNSGKTFRVILDTGCVLSSILSEKVTVDDAVSLRHTFANLVKYNDEGKISLVNQNQKYPFKIGGHPAEGKWLIDYLKFGRIGSVTFSPQFFSLSDIHTVTSNLYNKHSVSGSIGLARASREFPEIKHLFQYINSNNYLHQIGFFPALRAKRSCFVIGYFNKSLVKDGRYFTYQTIPFIVQSSDLWAIVGTVETIPQGKYYNGANSVGVKIIFNSGLDYAIALPEEIKNGLLDHIRPHSTITKSGEVKKIHCPWTADQFKFPKVELCADSQQRETRCYTLGFTDYSVKDSDTNECTLSIGTSDQHNVVYVGPAFFYKYFVGYNYKDKNLFLAEAEINLLEINLLGHGNCKL